MNSNIIKLKEKMKEETKTMMVNLERTLKQKISMLEFIEKNEEKLEKLDLSLDYFSTYLDFNYLKHEDVIRVIKTFPGNWKKTYHEDKINYELMINEFLGLRIWNSDPPSKLSNC